MNISHLQYQAERQLSTAEQRAADAQTGELAASFAQLGRSLRRATSWKGQAARHPARATASCAIPHPRSAAGR
jgi:hypothetical protein